MVTTVIDDRVRTASAALAAVRACRSSGAPVLPLARQVIAAVGPADDQPLIALLRRYFHSSREFLVYGHALALGPAPLFVREPGAAAPTYLIAMPTLLGAEFPLAMQSFHSTPELQEFFSASMPDWATAAEQLSEAVSRLNLDSALAQWFPDARQDVRLFPDLTGVPGQVVAMQSASLLCFACAPSVGKCAWDAAHIGSAVLLELVRPLVESTISPADAGSVADLLGLSRILAQVVSGNQTLKHSFLLANPDFCTRLVEIICRALVAVALGRALGKNVSRSYLNEQSSAVGGETVELVANNMLRYLRLVARPSLGDFLQHRAADLEAPLFARIAAN